jgi:hypothetical protein
MLGEFIDAVAEEDKALARRILARMHRIMEKWNQRA